MFLLTHIFACAWFINGCPYYDKYISDNQGEISSSHSHEKSLYPHQNDSSLHGYYTQHSWTVENGRNGWWKRLHSAHHKLAFGSSKHLFSWLWDTHAYVVGKRVLAVICLIVGVVFYGYVIASAAASLANADAQRAHYQQKLNTIIRFLKNKTSDQLWKRQY